MVHKSDVVLPYSNFKHNLAKVLQTEGWIKTLEVKEIDGIKSLALQLKYDSSGVSVITGIKRVSKPGQRIYSGRAEIPRVMGGMGSTIISTSKGLMTDKQARENKIGGEVVCQIW
jgi:small subunit ribosomal protein S8